MVPRIGAAMVGGKLGKGKTSERQEDDWYPTPDEVTEVLLPYLNINGTIHEPCCGDGAMARVLERGGHEVIGTDIRDRGYGVGHGSEYDVMKLKKLVAPNVVTNPPFKIAGPIIKHLLDLKPDCLAMLLKGSFWHAKSRLALFESNPPSKIIALTWRPDFMNRKRPTMEVIWCVWEKDYVGVTQYIPVRRPKKKKQIKAKVPKVKRIKTDLAA